MSIIIDYMDPECSKRRFQIGRHKYNGAVFYSKEIVQNIIPNVKTDRNWMTMIAGTKGADHSICFVHNNISFEEKYEYTRQYKDVIYVVGLPDMVERAEKFGKTIYLPLSVDVEYVKKFQKPKSKDLAVVGRDAVKWKEEYNLPEEADTLGLIRRQYLLPRMSRYRKVYAIGRTAIEAKILGCEVLPFHPRLLDTSMWKILDNKEAAKILQVELDKIDR